HKDQSKDEVYAEEEVAGASAVREDVTYGQKNQDIEYAIFPRTWLKVRSGPSTNDKIIGYTRRVEGIQYGEEFWGGTFYPEEKGKVIQTLEGRWLGKWIKSMFYLWEEVECNTNDYGCEEGRYKPVLDESGSPKQEIGYIAELELVVNKVSFD